jgi:glyoxylase-like metal-dependent hydrolase (beta-lactamase superfamily II)
MRNKVKSLSIVFILFLTIFFLPVGFASAKPKKKDIIINNSNVIGNVWRFQENVSVQILNGTDLVTGYYTVNIYVIDEDDGLILIDSGVEAYAKQLKKKLNERFGKKNIKAILLTHAHADHAGGAKFLANGKADIYAHISDWPLIQDGMNFLNDTQFTYKGYSPTKILENATTLFTNVFVRHTPGHTNGSVTFEYCVLEPVETTILFTGDTTLPYPDPEFPDYQEFPEDLTFILDFYTCIYETHDFNAQLVSLNQLGNTNVDLICPGHAEYCENPIPYLFSSISLVSLAQFLSQLP